MPPSPSTEVVSLDVRLRPDELLAAWRAESRRLVLKTQEPVRAQQRIAARITALGRDVAATITGRVATASRDGTGLRIELVPDPTRLRALERLLAVARGQAVHYQARIPRYLATMPAVVHGPAGPIFMTTFSVSENGCGLAWSGPVEAVTGAELDIRLGAGSRAVTFRGVICWTARCGSMDTVGVRFVRGTKHAWAMMVTDARRAGAPPA